MGRIPVVPENEAGVLGRLAYRYARRRYGDVPEPFAVLRHHRRLFWAAAVAEWAYEKALVVLPVQLRHLVTYRVATVVGCSWCVDFGTMLQRLDGVDVDRLRHIDDYGTSSRFSSTEQLALAYADAMTAQPTTVSDDLAAALETALGRDGLVELTFAIGLENMRARSNHALGITDQGFSAHCSASRDLRS